MPGARPSRSGSDTGTSVHSPDRKGAPPHKPFGGRVRNPFCEGPSIPPVKVYVVDNGGQWTHRGWRGPPRVGRGGGPPRTGTGASAMGRNGEYLARAEVPILGICAGHQFMALHLGGDAKAAKVPEFGKTRLVVDAENTLFEGLPREFEVWESHNDEVAALPKGFELLAHSENCGVQAMRSRDRPLFGVQFHPEVEHTQFGYDIFRNFLKACGAGR